MAYKVERDTMGGYVVYCTTEDGNWNDADTIKISASGWEIYDALDKVGREVVVRKNVSIHHKEGLCGCCQFKCPYHDSDGICRGEYVCVIDASVQVMESKLKPNKLQRTLRCCPGAGEYDVVLRKRGCE